MNGPVIMDHNLHAHIQTTQTQFYQERGGKNTFFKKTQKFECAETVCQNIPLDNLFERTFCIQDNRVLCEYPFFKLYAHPGIFVNIVDRVIELCIQCRTSTENGRFSLHVNFDGFTLSAAERYKDLVVLFSRLCEIRNTGFIPHIDGLYLYNVSDAMDHVSQMLMPLIPPEMRGKIKLVKKSV